MRRKKSKSKRPPTKSYKVGKRRYRVVGTGKTTLSRDVKRKAKKYGWRKSKSGKKYWEGRANRVDGRKKHRGGWW